MDMLKGDQIAEANLTDWRKLAQGLHAGRCWCCRQLTRRFTRTRLVVGAGAGPAGRRPAIGPGHQG
jgi:4a-hydroxytetrahydrobiopterin dehydratase